MDFFAQQDTARRRTWVLVVYLGLALICMIATIYFVIAGLLMFANMQDDDKPRYAERPPGQSQPAVYSLWNPGLLFLVGVGVPMVVGGGSLFKALQLSGGGGKSVATMLGGKKVSANTTDRRERQLLNVVEEMAIASGMPAPSVYILEEEDTINAFAAGYTTDDAVIGVNRGALNYLTRDELQGVIAHEFSHILNGDMRFNIRLIAILYGILVLATIGFYVFRMAAYSGSGGSRSKKGNVPIIVIALVIIVVGYSGLFFARLIKAAISRQREYLADASAVQFTRNPDGIAGALKKIGGLSNRGAVKSPEAEAASHLFFASALGGDWGSLWSTHPPLVQRIQAIDPSFDGKFPPTQPLAPDPPPQRSDPQPAQKGPFPNFPTPMGQAMPMPLPIDPTIVVASLANPNEESLHSAQDFIRGLPRELYDALHDVYSARFVVYSMLLDDDDSIRSNQLNMVGDSEPQAAELTEKYAQLIQSLGRESRLPIIEMAQSSLVDMSPAQFEQFSRLVEQLIQADNRVSLFEFILKRLVVEHLGRRIGTAPIPRIRYSSMSGVQKHVEVVISLLARIGHTNEAETQGAFAAAMKDIDNTSTQPLAIGDCGLKQMEAAFDTLFESAPAIKKRVLHAAWVCIAYDGEVTVNEAELFRAISDALGVPSPPISVGAIE